MKVVYVNWMPHGSKALKIFKPTHQCKKKTSALKGFLSRRLEVFLKKRYSENIQQIYRGTPMPKFNFNKVAL